MAGSVAQLLQFALDASADNYPVSVTWTAGDWAHVMVWASEAACTTTLEDNLGNTFVFIGSVREAAINCRVHHYYVNISTGGAATMTARWFSDVTPFGALAVINRQIVVKRLAGVTAFQAGGGQDVLSENPTHACEVTNTSQPAYLSMLGVNMQSGTFTANVGAGWTDEGFITGSGGGGSLDARAQGKSVSTVGVQSGQLLNTSSDRGVAVMAIFTEAILPPTYIQQPANATVYGSRPISFVAEVSNPGTYQWYDNSGGSFAAISGETGPALTFQATAAMNGRQFYLIATNGSGSLQSNTVTLTFIAAAVPQMRTIHERLPRGGDDVWDQVQASVLLDNDVFDNVVASGGLANVWTGSAWQAKPVKYWNGSSWTTKPLKRWNGGAWV